MVNEMATYHNSKAASKQNHQFNNNSNRPLLSIPDKQPITEDCCYDDDYNLKKSILNQERTPTQPTQRPKTK